MYAAGGLGISGGGASVAGSVTGIMPELYGCGACCRWVNGSLFDAFVSSLAFSNAFSSAALITAVALDMGGDIGGGVGVGLVPVVNDAFLDGIAIPDDFFLEASLASIFFLIASFSAAASINSF